MLLWFRKDPVSSQTGSAQKLNLVLLLGVSFIALVVILAWFALERVQEKIKAESGDALQTVLQTTRESLNFWTENGKFQLAQLAQDPRLVSLVQRQLKVPRNRKALIKSTVLKELRKFFRQNADRFGQAGFFIISPDFNSIASIRDDNIGATNLIALQRRDLLGRALQGETVLVPPIQSDVLKTEATMFFVAPIKNEQGKVIAGILFV
jgi:hypothetical protein